MRIVNFLGVPQNTLEDLLIFVAERVHDRGPKHSAREILAAIERLAAGRSPEQVKATPPPSKEEVEKQGVVRSAGEPNLRDPDQDVGPTTLARRPRTRTLPNGTYATKCRGRRRSPVGECASTRDDERLSPNPDRGPARRAAAAP